VRNLDSPDLNPSSMQCATADLAADPAAPLAAAGDSAAQMTAPGSEPGPGLALPGREIPVPNTTGRVYSAAQPAGQPPPGGPSAWEQITGAYFPHGEGGEWTKAGP
jgi:hypothetical protein